MTVAAAGPTAVRNHPPAPRRGLARVGLRSVRSGPGRRHARYARLIIMPASAW
jgi:hypothetical protein